MKRWELFLPVDLSSKNRAELARGGRARFGAYKRIRDKYAWTVKAICRQRHPDMERAMLYPFSGATDAVSVPFRRVTIVRLMGKRQRPFDDDGLVSGAAVLRDACQRERYHAGRFILGAGIVWDDSAKWSEWKYEQRKSDDGKPGVLMIVEED